MIKQLHGPTLARAFVKAVGPTLTIGCLLLSTSSCRQQSKLADRPALDSNVLARVQGQIISEASYRQKLAGRFRGTGSSPSAADRQAVLDELIDQEAIYAQAKAARFEEQPEVAALIKNLVVSRFIEREMGAEAPPVTSEAIQNYYSTRRNDWVNPVAVRASILFLRGGPRLTPDKREELKERGTRWLAEAQQSRDEGDFARLIQRHSEHQATRYRAGDAGWMTHSQWEIAFDADVAAAVFALREPNSFAPLLETSAGLYLIQLRERREAALRPLSEVQDVIRHRLGREQQRQREQDFHARMRQGLEIEIQRPLLESISIPAPEPEPPVLPGSRQARGIANR